MRIALVILLILNSALVFGQDAEFSFDKKVIKLDPVVEGDTIEVKFTFQNTGKVPLHIDHYEVECDCTKAKLPNHDVAVGDYALIPVSFDTNGKIGWQYRKIKLYANTKKSPTIIEIRVKVLNP